MVFGLLDGTLHQRSGPARAVPDSTFGMDAAQKATSPQSRPWAEQTGILADSSWLHWEDQLTANEQHRKIKASSAIAVMGLARLCTVLWNAGPATSRKTTSIKRTPTSSPHTRKRLRPFRRGVLVLVRFTVRSICDTSTPQSLSCITVKELLDAIEGFHPPPRRQRILHCRRSLPGLQCLRSRPAFSPSATAKFCQRIRSPWGPAASRLAFGNDRLICSVRPTPQSTKEGETGGHPLGSACRK